MNHHIEQFIKKYILPKEDKSLDTEPSEYKLAKGVRILKVTSLRWIKDISLILLGIFSAAFGLKSFLLPNSFIDGGATGISLLITELTGFPFALLIIAINLPFILLGYHVIGKQFAIKTAASISLLALVMATISFPDLTDEKILVAVFGGFFLGAGIGLSIRGGAVIDGTEVLALYLSRKLGVTVGDIITLLNIIIFSTAAYFLSIETAMYSLITYLSASKTVDFIIEGIEEYTGITIVSVHSDAIRQMITNKLGRGVTVYNGKRGYGKQGHTNDIDIIFTVITRLEINKLNSEIQIIDPNAFVVMNSIKDTIGGMVKKRPLAH
ncbi:MAG: YitT family protein [Bacteroidetes bacterium]|nr:YitT family protein [Bacteroidota bacterium]